jgi:reactive intermediate/imine deaminase
MHRRAIQTDDAATPGGAYSQGIVANGFLYTSGMGPIEVVTGAVVGTGIEEQTEKTLANLAAVLAAEGLDFSNVVRATVHLQDLQRDFERFNETYEKHFPKPYPVRTTVGSQLDGILVEIDLIAAIPD